MTCGIYILRFNGTDKVYIGQSENIQGRYTDHVYALVTCIHSKKMNAAYTSFGIPKLEVLVECSKEELNSLENEAIEIFKAVDNGFNTNKLASGTHTSLFGDTHGRSKYSNAKIVEVFEYLADTEETLKSISILTGVSYSTVQLISSASRHSWLQRAYPDKYSLLLLKKSTRSYNCAKSKGIDYPLLLSPEGALTKVDNLCKFAKESGLDASNLHKVLTCKAKSHKGWKLAE